MPLVAQNNTPCPTLFVANLGPTCTEQELIQVFSRLVSIFLTCIFCHCSLKVQHFCWLKVQLFYWLCPLDALGSWNWRCKAHMELQLHLLIFRYLCLLWFDNLSSRTFLKNRLGCSKFVGWCCRFHCSGLSNNPRISCITVVFYAYAFLIFFSTSIIYYFYGVEKDTHLLVLWLYDVLNRIWTILCVHIAFN